jgi:hypothetical protein
MLYDVKIECGGSDSVGKRQEVYGIFLKRSDEKTVK